MPKLRKLLPAVSICLAIMLIASGVVIRKLIDSNLDYFRREMQVRIEPSTPQLSRTYSRTEGRKMALIGDSRVELWKTADIPGHRMVNLGVSNQTTSQILLRLPATRSTKSSRIVCRNRP